MPYWECVTRSFRIAWARKYLWLIALFSGEAGGFSFNYSQSTSNTSSQTDFATFQNQVTTWLADHVALIVLVAVVWLLLVIAFFILAAVCEGATVRASAEHDAERPFGLGWAWRSGVGTMWVVIRFRLLFLLLYLPLFLLFAGFVVGVLAGLGHQNGGVVASFVGLGFLLVLIAIPYLIYLFLLDRLGTRAVVLEQLMAWPAIVRAHRLVFKRLGRTLLVWLLGIAVAIVVGIALACVFALIFAPLVLVGVAIGATNSTAVVPLVVVGVVVLFAISLVVQSFFAAQGSSYWTLAFRRLDIEYVPAPSYQFQPPPPAPPAPAQ